MTIKEKAARFEEIVILIGAFLAVYEDTSIFCSESGWDELESLLQKLRWFVEEYGPIPFGLVPLDALPPVARPGRNGDGAE